MSLAGSYSLVNLNSLPMEEFMTGLINGESVIVIHKHPIDMRKNNKEMGFNLKKEYDLDSTFASMVLGLETLGSTWEFLPELLHFLLLLHFAILHQKKNFLIVFLHLFQYQTGFQR